MHERDVELFNDSLERCSCNPGFLQRFYALFLASSDTVAKKFEHTDLRRQARMLRASLYIMMLAGGGSERTVHLERLARLHGRAELDIKPELYDLWLDQLVRAVEEFDAMYDPEIGMAWRRVLQPGIAFMKAGY